MAKTKSEIKKIIQNFITLVEEVFYVNEVYLFGSYSRKVTNKYSDIDLAVVSKDFQYMNEFIALKILARLACKVDGSIESLAFTPNDLKNPPLGSIEYTIKKEGKRVYP